MKKRSLQDVEVHASQGIGKLSEAQSKRMRAAERQVALDDGAGGFNSGSVSEMTGQLQQLEVDDEFWTDDNKKALKFISKSCRLEQSKVLEKVL